jgi:hypothetical protein
VSGFLVYTIKSSSTSKADVIHSFFFLPFLISLDEHFMMMTRFHLYIQSHREKKKKINDKTTASVNAAKVAHSQKKKKSYKEKKKRSRKEHLFSPPFFYTFHDTHGSRLP